MIKVGKEGNDVPFMTGVDRNPLAINYFSFSSWYGKTAAYKLERQTGTLNRKQVFNLQDFYIFRIKI